MGDKAEVVVARAEVRAAGWVRVKAWVLAPGASVFVPNVVPRPHTSVELHVLSTLAQSAGPRWCAREIF